MARDRFIILLKFLHFTNNTNLYPSNNQEYDPCSRFQPLVDHANTLFQHHYVPHQYISIDESLVGTKNHTQVLQYMPNKKYHRWGIKF